MTGWGQVLAIEAQERIFYALASEMRFHIKPLARSEVTANFKLRSTRNLYLTHATVADNRQMRMITIVRDFNTDRLRGFDDIHALRHL
jgi:hypothetical protein